MWRYIEKVNQDKKEINFFATDFWDFTENVYLFSSLIYAVDFIDTSNIIRPSSKFFFLMSFASNLLKFKYVIHEHILYARKNLYFSVSFFYHFFQSSISLLYFDTWGFLDWDLIIFIQSAVLFSTDMLIIVTIVAFMVMRVSSEDI